MIKSIKSALLGVAFAALFYCPVLAQSFGTPPQNPTIYPADTYFKSGRPWYDVRAFGAVGDAVTDDSTALNAAATAAGVTGGTLYFPNGNYCWKTGGSISGGVAVEIRGEGLNTEIQTCGADVTLLTLNNARHYLHDIVLAGPNILATTHDTIAIGSACTECRLDHLFAVQGRFVINNAGADVNISNSTFTQAYGSAIIFNGTASGVAQFWGQRLKVDQTYPGAVPAGHTAAYAAWVANTPYTQNTIVSLGGFFIQATTGGTSNNGASPTLLPYNTAIIDGTVTWKLLARTTLNAIQIDSNSFDVTLNQIDATGPFQAGLYIVNTLAAAGAQNTSVTDSDFGEAMIAGIYLNSSTAAGFDMKGSQVQNCTINGCAGINVSAFAGDITVATNLFAGNAIGIYVASGTNTAIVGNNIFGSSQSAVFLNCPVTGVTVSGNNLGSSATWGANIVGITMSGGTCDFVYGLQSSNFNGATTPFSLSGGAILGNHTDAYPLIGNAVVKGVNFNSANTDTQIAIPVPPGAIGYAVATIRIFNASQTLTTATFGLFTAAAGGGTAIQAAGTAITVATATFGGANSMQAVAPATAGTTAYAAATTPLFFRVGTAQGAAATGDVSLQLVWVY